MRDDVLQLVVILSSLDSEKRKDRGLTATV